MGIIDDCFLAHRFVPAARFLATIMESCPLLSSVNLTSCRGVPVTQRRTWFEAWAKGEVVVNER